MSREDRWNCQKLFLYCCCFSSRKRIVSLSSRSHKSIV